MSCHTADSSKNNTLIALLNCSFRVLLDKSKHLRFLDLYYAGFWQICGLSNKIYHLKADTQFFEWRPLILQAVQTESCLRNSLNIELLSSIWLGHPLKCFSMPTRPFDIRLRTCSLKFHNCIMKCVLASPYMVTNQFFRAVVKSKTLAP